MTDQQNPERNDMVAVINGQPSTTTLVIAEGVGNQHKNVLAMVRQYQADLERFGQLAFETRPRLDGQHGGGDVEFAHLNERQATLLLSYMRNTDIIRAFKIAMVEAFFAMAEELQHNRQAPVIPGMAMAIGNYSERDRPAMVPTIFGNAYINTATFFLHFIACKHPESDHQRLLASALLSRSDFAKALPSTMLANHKLKKALLKSNPLWSDIMLFHSMGTSRATIARLCGCHPSTVKRQLKKMEEVGLFDDPLAGLEGLAVEMVPGLELRDGK